MGSNAPLKPVLFTPTKRISSLWTPWMCGDFEYGLESLP